MTSARSVFSGQPEDALLDQDLLLLQRWRKGDLAAGNQLLQRCFDPLYRFFSNKARNFADVEELMQSTFEALVVGRDKFEGRSCFLTYALGVACNLLRGYYRRLSHDAHRNDPLESSIADLGVGAQTCLEGLESQRLVLAALRQIPAEFQIVLELYYVEEMKPETIAEALDLNINTVRSRIQRGRRLLQCKVEELMAPRLSASDAVADFGEMGLELVIKSAFPSRNIDHDKTED